jgi:RIO kinase 1
VEHDHPYALDFLRKDIQNVNHFFGKKNVVTFSNRELFDFVTDINIVPQTEEQIFDQVSKKEGKEI